MAHERAKASKGQGALNAACIADLPIRYTGRLPDNTLNYACLTVAMRQGRQHD